MELNITEELNSNNYCVYSEDAKVLFLDRNCWNIVIGEVRSSKENSSQKKSRISSLVKVVRIVQSI